MKPDVAVEVGVYSGWVPAQERLPEPGVWVLGITPFGSYVVATCNSPGGEHWSDQQGYTVYPTHWLPLPPPPDPAAPA